MHEKRLLQVKGANMNVDWQSLVSLLPLMQPRTQQPSQSRTGPGGHSGGRGMAGGPGRGPFGSDIETGTDDDRSQQPRRLRHGRGRGRGGRHVRSVPSVCCTLRDVSGTHLHLITSFGGIRIRTSTSKALQEEFSYQSVKLTHLQPIEPMLFAFYRQSDIKTGQRMQVSGIRHMYVSTFFSI